MRHERFLLCQCMQKGLQHCGVYTCCALHSSFILALLRLRKHAALLNIDFEASPIINHVNNTGWKFGWTLQALYPLTLALEKEGAEGAELQKLQLVAQIAGRAAVLSPPQGSPARSKAGKARPQRRWHQE